MPPTRVRISKGDGAEAEPELELDVTMSGEPTGEWWTARTSASTPCPPTSFAEGPVVVTVLEGVLGGSRADAWARTGHDGTVIVLEGATPFVRRAAADATDQSSNATPKRST
jgi:hypothetical protein